MLVRQHRRTALPLALAIAGALLAAFALMVTSGNRAEALENCDVTHLANDGEETAFLGLINAYRAENSLSALTISTNLNRGSAWMVQDMADEGYFSHTDSLGRSPYARAIDCGYPTGAGENIAAGTTWSSAATAFNAWKNSPGHNANMLGANYKQIGIARFNKPGSQYTWYWATTFGTTNDGTGGGGAGNPTATPTNTQAPPTSTPTKTPTSQPTQPPQNTPTPSATQPGSTSTPPPATSTPTRTPTQPPTGGSTVTATPTPTLTPTATATPTLTATNTPTATPTSAGSPSLPLSPGANLVAWPGENATMAQAFGGNTNVAVVYEWDPVTGEWKRYFPGLPAYLNNLTNMKKGGAYWVIAKSSQQLKVSGW